MLKLFFKLLAFLRLVDFSEVLLFSISFNGSINSFQLRKVCFITTRPSCFGSSFYSLKPGFNFFYFLPFQSLACFACMKTRCCFIGKYFIISQVYFICICTTYTYIWFDDYMRRKIITLIYVTYLTRYYKKP